MITYVTLVIVLTEFFLLVIEEKPENS